ncbi:MBL fold metallo-hydrolase [Indiicoccus explosivorum]|uniref:MBL fold metallo-hydrolase n=1 Tax=Indiicoccus explosivorum TaxID=1917864 RepID=UPI000B437704|nr:MBL fold metallo-hydrolase [Indiicoccus explosivorum]
MASQDLTLTPVGIWGGYPAAGGATSSFLLEQAGFRCLIDCGSGVLSSVQKHLGLSELDAVVISHYHADHIADIGPLQFARMIDKQLGGNDRLLPVYGHTEDPEQFEKLSYKEVTKGYEIKEDQAVRIGPWEVTFCKTAHPVYCLAMRFSDGEKSVVFTADTGWRKELAEFAADADLLVAESNLFEEHVGRVEGHMSGRQAGELAAKASAKTLLLTHLPQYGELERIRTDAEKAFDGPVELAEAGKAYKL